MILSGRTDGMINQFMAPVKHKMNLNHLRRHSKQRALTYILGFLFPLISLLKVLHT